MKGRISKYQFRLLLGSIISLMGADGILSSFVLQNNLAIEVNPIVRNLALDNNFPMLKIIGALISVFLLSHAIKIKPRLIYSTAVVVVFGYTLIVYWNLFVFFIVNSHSL